MKRIFFLSLFLVLFPAVGWAIADGPVNAAPEATAVASLSAAPSQTLFTAAPAKDTWISQSAPSDNYGAQVNLWTRRLSGGEEDHTLLYFDTGSLPDNINIISATLSVYSEINRAPDAPDAGLFVQPEAVLADWNENTVTWNNRPAGVYLSDPAVEYQVGWLDYDVTNIAQAWADGSVVNHGIKLTPQAAQTGWAFIFSREAGGGTPELRISYEILPPPCTAVTGVTIDGPTTGQPGSDYTFNATVSPADATEPYTYTWRAVEHVNSNDPSPTFNWSTTGDKTINLLVENCGGSATDTHIVTIEEPPPECDIPLTDLTLEGPTSGANGRTYTFSAVAGPADADAPITFTWQATDQSGQQSSGGAHTSDIAWRWNSTGSKQIAVTAENCGASFTRNLTIDIVAPSTLPDLTVSSPWYDAVQGIVGYLIRNEGQSEAPAGHTTTLSEDSSFLADDVIADPIPGGGVRAGDFGNAWDNCAGANGWLSITADSDNIIEEGSETNNTYNVQWPCDLRAPAITAGPIVVDKTAVSADITWTTDETTNGWLEYGLTGYAPTVISSTVTDAADHSAALTGLQPAATYRVRAFAEDAAGNRANSEWHYFETNTPGVDPPAFTAIETVYLANHEYDIYILKANLDDTAYIDRVEFYLDGALVSADYDAYFGSYGVYLSPPEMGYTPASFFEQALTVEARAYTTNGLSTTDSLAWQPEPRKVPVTLQFWEPGIGEEMEVNGDQAPDGTDIDARVFAVETDWKCSWGGSTPNTTGLLPVDCAEANPRPVQKLRLRLNGQTVEVVEPVPDFAAAFSVDLSGLRLGDHDFNAYATGSDNRITDLERTFELVRGEPDFSYEREVTRQGNLFAISFSVTNEGTAAARVERIQDTLYGFQVIHRDYLPGRTAESTAVDPWYTVRTKNTWYESTTLDIDLSSSSGDYVLLPPGESFTVNYRAAPILYRTPGNAPYRIGAKPESLFHHISYREDFDDSGLWTDDFFAVVNSVNDAELGGQVPLHQSVMNAVAKTDYIIITSPYGLAVHAADTGWAGVDPAQERERLYSDMAELAGLADGVIAYYVDTHGYDLDDLLEPGGYWYESLHPNFRQTLQGYVLIIGEHEVAPVMGGGYDVPWSDLRYASTGGGDGRPELVLGRIIGNDVATMRRPLDAAIRYHQGFSDYDHSHALLYSGREEGEGYFWDAIKDIDHRLPDATDVTRIRSEAINTAQEEPQFLNNTPNRDIIVYRGHGYTNGNGFAISDESGINTTKINGLGGFGDTRPFVMALACTAGDYEADDDYGIAEATLREGAAVFIGANSLSHRFRNNEAARWFFNRFGPDRSVGDTFADLLRDKFHEWSFGDEVTNDTEWGRWSYQYQLYGDPKFGRLNPAPARAPAETDFEMQGSSTLTISLGDMSVVEDDGWHLVTIPEGGHIQGEGQYIVPMQQVIAHYPAGTRVQDVQIAVRSGLVVTTGLNIPLSYFRQDAGGVQQQFYGAPTSSAADPNVGWRPRLDRPFTWRTAENNDGSSDLLLVIFPFAYEPATTNARYYKEWTFNVETISSSVAIDAFQTGAARYPLGETVTATLKLDNSGAAQDVIVKTVVRDLRGVEIAGLPLRTLHDLPATAVIDVTWDSSSIPAGDYVLETAVLNTQGQALHKQRAGFTLGLVQAEGVRLEAGSYPGSGGGVPLDFIVRNSGDTVISGTLHLRVENVATGEIVATFSQNTPHFQPGSEVQMNVVWDDGNAPSGAYRAVGYLHTYGTISEPLIRPLGQHTLYLPAVRTEQ